MEASVPKNEGLSLSQIKMLLETLFFDLVDELTYLLNIAFPKSEL